MHNLPQETSWYITRTTAKESTWLTQTHSLDRDLISPPLSPSAHPRMYLWFEWSGSLIQQDNSSWFILHQFARLLTDEPKQTQLALFWSHTSRTTSDNYKSEREPSKSQTRELAVYIHAHVRDKKAEPLQYHNDLQSSYWRRITVQWLSDLNINIKPNIHLLWICARSDGQTQS